MAFDQSTRTRLQRFVSEARDLLTDEFTRQLQQNFGMNPDTGEVTELESLGHLDDEQLATARLLRDIYHHYLATQPKKDKATQKSVLLRIAREQAFTVLNRLAALRLMEARGLILVTVAQGYESDAFQLYSHMASHALGGTGDAYRVFLHSVFDELSQELPQLFDRFAPQGQLFPRDTELLELLDLINDAEIESLWSEDETIGWIYQYFNSAEERKAMRKASGAPRNSRELAVRNQFFTPRYVVEFLVDNSLGRAWFDWTGGQTGLYERCQYLLRKPDDASALEGHSLRDPRSIRLLDPACGSMHFGLYAFDLFEVIYREAWDWEQRYGPGSLTSDEGFEPLQADYENVHAFLRDVPRLILAHNIHGVDIDARATQIATLALWLRAQRAWHDEGIKAEQRPCIERSNVVAAVAPPAEPEIRKRIATRMDQNDAALFEETLKMLNGLPELGLLLRTEQLIPKLIQEIYGSQGELFEEEDRKRWAQAERRLREDLEAFIHEAQSTYQGRLFAQDALECLRLMDLVEVPFDLVVMNPPFGALAKGTKSQLGKAYSKSKNDLLAIFVERGIELLRVGGRVGAITSRTCFFLSSFQKWREEIITEKAVIDVIVDLGLGVMDDAMVEASTYVLEKTT
jgi:hypothetical protein